MGRLAGRVRDDRLPKVLEIEERSVARLRDSAMTLSEVASVPREVSALRRVSRLVARLKEPFLPFALRRLTGQGRRILSREEIETAVAEAERRDPLLFKEPLFPAPRRRRIDLRQFPVVVVTPAGGEIGFSWHARTGGEIGRIVLPAFTARPHTFDRLLWEVLADFRYDTSKASAGVDFLGSDTLAAAYSRVRWNFRKRSRPVREKAAIYMKENDRVNWRRHYGLYMDSAFDAGKKLFFRSKEIYETLLEYLDLPEGVERVR
jgi:hypothetical protein